MITRARTNFLMSAHRPPHFERFSNPISFRKSKVVVFHLHRLSKLTSLNLVAVILSLLVVLYPSCQVSVALLMSSPLSSSEQSFIFLLIVTTLYTRLVSTSFSFLRHSHSTFSSHQTRQKSQLGDINSGGEEFSGVRVVSSLITYA
jgi:hypothetical protein